MLTISVLTPNQVAARCFMFPNCLMQDTPRAFLIPHMIGSIVGDGDLTEPFDVQKLDALLAGRAPDGRDLTKGLESTRSYRPGLVLNFSTPGSVTNAVLLQGDKRVYRSHLNAVFATIAFAENYICKSRELREDGTNTGTVGKIIACLFLHQFTLTHTPQLHMQAIVPNMIKGEDDRYRELWIEGVLDQTLVLSRIYLDELSQRLEAINYVVHRAQEGLFEISDPPDEGAEGRLGVDVWLPKQPDLESGPVPLKRNFGWEP